MDYPFNLKGILYFPKINMEYESIEGTIKLYNNQVFIADNIKEVIPEFLLLLKGVIDCPDLPLNVSRSALQNDGFVKKISDYITKKVAEKLNGMCKTDRKTYETYWDDIAPFIKYGFLKDEKFAERINDSILFKNIDGKYLTLKDCLEENKERFENRIFYVTDEKEQGQYIRMFREEGIDAVILPHAIDMPFLSRLEQKNQDLKFLRIDADINDALREEQTEAPDEEAKKTGGGAQKGGEKGDWKRKTDGSAGKFEGRRNRLPPDHFRGQPPHAGDDEAVRHGRRRGYVCRRGGDIDPKRQASAGAVSEKSGHCGGSVVEQSGDRQAFLRRRKGTGGGSTEGYGRCPHQGRCQASGAGKWSRGSKAGRSSAGDEETLSDQAALPAALRSGENPARQSAGKQNGSIYSEEQ